MDEGKDIGSVEVVRQSDDLSQETQGVRCRRTEPRSRTFPACATQPKIHLSSSFNSLFFLFIDCFCSNRIAKSWLPGDIMSLDLTVRCYVGIFRPKQATNHTPKQCRSGPE